MKKLILGIKRFIDDVKALLGPKLIPVPIKIKIPRTR
jgi:hypothetical protein